MFELTVKDWQRDHVLQLLISNINRTKQRNTFHPGTPWCDKLLEIQENLRNGSNIIGFENPDDRSAFLQEIIKQAKLEYRKRNNKAQQIMQAAACFYYDNTGELHSDLIISWH